MLVKSIRKCFNDIIDEINTSDKKYYRELREKLSVLGEDEREYFMSFPLTRNGEYDIKALRYTIGETKKIFEARGQQLYISLIPLFSKISKQMILKR